ncbi:MAG: xanthine dehydrogenase family protein subunit M [Halioglobus sp.]
MMPDTHYYAPQSLEEVVTLLRNSSDSQILAGGTDLLVQMRSGAKSTGQIIDIKNLPDIKSVVLADAGLTIGAAAPAQSITEREDITALYPGLVESIDLIGSTQIQGRCSVGGNLCNASPAADTVPALIANNAVCLIHGANGPRQIPVIEFNLGPGQNCLDEGEFLTAVFIPRPAARTADAYLRFIPRTEMDIAVVGAGVSLTLDASGTCTAARVAIGAVAPVALSVPEAAKALIGSKITDQTLASAAAAASAAATPISDKRGTVEFRRKVVGVMVKRAATSARDRIMQANGENQ